MKMELIVDFPGASPQATPRVSFTDGVEITEVENLSCHHKDILWFTSREMRTFKHHAVLVLRSLESMNITMVQYAEMNVDDTR